MGAVTQSVLRACDTPGDSRVLREVLVELSRKRQVERVLEEWLEASDEEKKKSARASYEHVNGFGKFVLADGGPDGPRIRLHTWDGVRPMSPVHSHSWHFASLIVAGRLKVRNVTLREGPKRLAVRSLPRLKARNAGASVTEREMNAEIAAAEEILERGTVHDLAAGAFHAVGSLDPGCTTTFVLQSRHHFDESQVIASGAQTQEPYQVRYLSTERLEAEVKRTLAAMRADR